DAALAARDATKNGDDSHTSGTGARRPVQAARKCSYFEFLKCKSLDFKDDALTWWNSYVKTTTFEEAYAMTWATLKKKMTGKYCPKGSRPLCPKCNYNHEGPCLPKCNNCKRVGHLTKDCRSRPAKNNNNNRNNNNQQGNGCFECGAQGHFKRNCPKLKNNDRGNQARTDRAPAR
nr:putative reverse transcriptase domain-containing protein [Tanacetum cinerariifolium]